MHRRLRDSGRLALTTPGSAGRERLRFDSRGDFDMASKGSSSKGGSFRSAVSGQFVTPRFAASHPRTTVHEAPPKKK